jgi:hypothetical protein
VVVLPEKKKLTVVKIEHISIKFNFIAYVNELKNKHDDDLSLHRWSKYNGVNFPRWVHIILL